jgi:hypothetical protein
MNRIKETKKNIKSLRNMKELDLLKRLKKEQILLNKSQKQKFTK